MKADVYMAGWARIMPLMLERLTAVTKRLEVAGFVPSSDPVEGGDEERRLTQELYRNGKHIGGLDFTLEDGDVQDGEGFAVSLRLQGSRAETLGGWSPYCWTEDFYTHQIEEIERRITEEFSVDAYAAGFIETLTGFEKEAWKAE